MKLDSAFMEQSASQFTERDEQDLLRSLDSIGLQHSDLLPSIEPCIVIRETVAASILR